MSDPLRREVCSDDRVDRWLQPEVPRPGRRARRGAPRLRRRAAPRRAGGTCCRSSRRRRSRSRPRRSGLSASEVEQLITVPIEQDLLAGVAFVDEIRSQSVPGLSSIVAIFEPGTDLLAARQVVAERMTQAHALPHVSRAPEMLQPLSSTSRVMMVGLSSETLSAIELSVLARWTIKPRLTGVPGRGERGGLRHARPAAAGPGRSGAAAARRTSPSSSCSRRPATRSGCHRSPSWRRPRQAPEASSTPTTSGSASSTSRRSRAPTTSRR